MNAQESKKQFKWCLDEYAATPSGRQAVVSSYNWGCSELMAIAANFLQRQIFVLAHNTDGKQNWCCSMFRPSTIARGQHIIEIRQQVPLQLDQCIAAVTLAKTSDQPMPLILRFWGEYYSAVVHKRPKEQQVCMNLEEKTENKK